MTRPFLWVNGRMTNLGSLGGSYAQARYISRQGDITGESALPGNKHFDAVLWRHGRKIALPRVGGAPDAFGVRVNDHGDVVGYETNAHNKDIMATLWTSDRRGYDLNKLVAPSNLRDYRRRLHRRHRRDRRPRRVHQRPTTGRRPNLPPDPQPVGSTTPRPDANSTLNDRGPPKPDPRLSPAHRPHERRQPPARHRRSDAQSEALAPATRHRRGFSSYSRLRRPS